MTARSDTIPGRSGGLRRSRPNPDGFKFRKVGNMVYEVLAPQASGPLAVIGTVGRDRDQSWWANPDGVSGSAARTAEGWRSRERAAHSLLAYAEAANGPGGDPFAGLSS